MPAGLFSAEFYLFAWMVALVRPGAAFLAAPFFGSASVPVQLRIILALAVAIPAVSGGLVNVPSGGWPLPTLFVLLAGELVLGLAIGFVVQIAYATASLAGELIGSTMGLSFASMVDPSSEHRSPVIGQFLATLATFLFFAMDAHLLFIRAIYTSFQTFPIGDIALETGLFSSIVAFGGTMFQVALAIAMPVGFSTVLVQIVMGMLGRSAPQLNLFAVGLPATLITGIVMIAIGLPTIASALTEMLQTGVLMATDIARGDI